MAPKSIHVKKFFHQSGVLFSALRKTPFTGLTRNYGQSNHILKSAVPSMEFEKGNFTEFVMANNIERCQNVALSCDVSNREVTYGEFSDKIARWGAFLKKKGLQKGSVVAVVSPNTVDYNSIIFGSVRVGVIFSGANPTYTASELAYQLKDSGASMVVCYGPLEGVTKEALKMNQQDVPLYSIGPESPSKIPRVEDILNDESLGFAEPAKLDGSETMSLMYSSGTTGRSKGTAVSHNANIANMQMMMHPDFFANSHSTVKEQKSTIQLLPLFHVGGLTVATSVALTAGLKIHNVTKFDPSTFLSYLKDNKITSLTLVPTILNFCLTSPQFTKDHYGHVEHILSGAAPVPPTAVAQVKERFGENLFIQHGYGMTETLATILDNKRDGLKLGYTGKLLPTVEAKVIDVTTGESLPANKDGEICVRAITMMKYYLNNEEATKSTIDEEGWLHSGDVGHYDEDGYIRIVDRTKELIKVNAYQVSPSEIESVILEIPEVAEVSVIGVPHDKLGEAPRAYVTTTQPIDQQKVIDHVKIKCAKLKHLEGGVRFISQLPKNATGKVMRKELVKMAQEE